MKSMNTRRDNECGKRQGQRPPPMIYLQMGQDLKDQPVRADQPQRDNNRRQNSGSENIKRRYDALEDEVGIGPRPVVELLQHAAPESYAVIPRHVAVIVGDDAAELSQIGIKRGGHQGQRS